MIGVPALAVDEAAPAPPEQSASQAVGESAPANPESANTDDATAGATVAVSRNAAAEPAAALADASLVTAPVPASAETPAAPTPGRAASLADTGIAVSGGTEGRDYSLDAAAKTLTVLTSTPLTLSGESAGWGVRIAPGVKARVTLAGLTVDLSAGSGIPLDVATNLYDVQPDGTQRLSAPAAKADDVTNKTTLLLTLADGTVNVLKGGDGAPALHCGESSVLVVDDAVANEDAQGRRIVPAQGAVPYDCTLSNGTVLAKGDPLYRMESPDPGVLECTGGPSGTGIGSGQDENSGDLTFDGGVIKADAYAPLASSAGGVASSGCGIGGSLGGSATKTTFNGGVVYARASAHGSGIGGGPVGKSGAWGSGGGAVFRSQLPDTITNPNKVDGQRCGDITINGGKITSEGGEHGYAFGTGCWPADNTGCTILITGGNLLPVNANGATGYSGFLGATGASIIVQGGSFNLAPTNFTGTVTDGAGNALTLVSISLGEDSEVIGSRIKSLTVKVDGVPLAPDYGLPYEVDEKGKVYFWLPATVSTKRVTVADLAVYDKASGTVTESEYDFVLPHEGEDGNVAKRNVEIDVTDQVLADDALRSLVRKRYDGLAVDPAALKDAVAALGVETTKPRRAPVTEIDSFTSQRLLDKDGKPDLEPIKEDGDRSFKRAGTYELVMESKQFTREDPSFGDSFWGHWLLFDAVIEAADTRVYDVSQELSYAAPAPGGGGDAPAGRQAGRAEEGALESVTFRASVMPNDQTGDGLQPEALTCEAPTGTVAFSVNGVEVGTAKLEPATDVNGTGYAWSKAELEWDPAGAAIPRRPDGRIVVEARYDGDKNYRGSSTRQADDALTEDEAPDYPLVDVPHVSVVPDDPDDPDAKPRPLEPTGPVEVREPGPDDPPGITSTVHVTVRDEVRVPPREGDPLTADDLRKWAEDRYIVTPGCEIAGITVNGSPDGVIDPSAPGTHEVRVVVRDPKTGNTTTVVVNYTVVKPDDPEEPDDPDGPDGPPTPPATDDPTVPDDPAGPEAPGGPDGPQDPVDPPHPADPPNPGDDAGSATKGPTAVLTRLAQTGDGALALAFAGLAGAASLAAAAAALARRRSARR